MRALIQQLAARAGTEESDGEGRPWSTVLVVGAGGCSEWGALRRLQAGRLVLVEPQPRLAEDLVRLVRGEPRAQVWPLALVPQGDQATLHLLTMARESGTAPPAAEFVAQALQIAELSAPEAVANFPAAHLVHSDFCVVDMYVPPPQGWHSLWPPLAEIFPRGHAVHTWPCR